MDDRTCRGCAVPLEKKPGPGRNPKYCSPACRHKATYVPRTRGPIKVDPEKASAAARTASLARWAGLDEAARRQVGLDRALARYGHFKPVPPPRPSIECPYCGHTLTGGQRQVCSSGVCRRRRNAERQSAYAHDRRLQMQAEGERFERSEIFERDGWTCGLCSEPVDSTIAYPDAASASLDHIVPLSKGGSHTRTNTQCAHLGCNARKGNRTAA